MNAKNWRYQVIIFSPGKDRMDNFMKFLGNLKRMRHA